MKCMKNITLAAFALCATQTVACMAPADEEVASDDAADAAELYWADGSSGACTGDFRGEFQRHDDGMGAHIAFKDQCTGSELVLWIASPDAEQPLYGAVDVVGFVETYDGELGKVDGAIAVDEDAPDFGSIYLSLGRAGVDFAHIQGTLQFLDPAGQPGRVDGVIKFY